MAEAMGKLACSPMASSEPVKLIGFVPFQRFISGMSDLFRCVTCDPLLLQRAQRCVADVDAEESAKVIPRDETFPRLPLMTEHWT